jgi:hypothetical protein
VIRHREQAISELGFGDSTRQALEELVKLALTRFGLGGIAAPPRELSQNLEPVPSPSEVSPRRRASSARTSSPCHRTDGC